MRFFIGSDHRGVGYKAIIRQRLEAAGHTVSDCGAMTDESVDYPDYAQAVARAVADGQADRGVLICSSGIGMSIAANRFSGVRAALCLSEDMAAVSRRHNNANVLCVARDFTDEATLERVLDAWLSAEFEGGRHSRRVEKIDGGCRPTS